ncbi:hypothetical protein ACN2C7_18405 [Caulobacter sp. ErkDOM-E]
MSGGPGRTVAEIDEARKASTTQNRRGGRSACSITGRDEEMSGVSAARP